MASKPSDALSGTVFGEASFFERGLWAIAQQFTWHCCVWHPQKDEEDRETCSGDPPEPT